ncbi:MAG: hypothetical protein WC004_00610, partial [Candidatus Absconditabacterales bacterium]
ADDTTGAAFNTDAATTTAVPEAVVKETAQEQVTKKTNVKPPAGKKKSAEKTRPAPAQYSNPKTWTATQKKWADVIGQRGSLQVGQATTLMTTDATKAKGIYALYATERYLALGNETAAEEQWIKFQIERNGLHSALLNSLFEVSKLCDHGFATFVANKAAQQKAPSKKKKKKS